MKLYKQSHSQSVLICLRKSNDICKDRSQYQIPEIEPSNSRFQVSKGMAIEKAESHTPALLGVDSSDSATDHLLTRLRASITCTNSYYSY